MARYIKDCDCAKVISEKFNIPLGDVIDVVYDIPTADVVEVVRCKDCDVPHNKWTGCPHLNGLIPQPMFYCAFGERKNARK